MAMTVTYSVVPRKNPAKKDESAKYYAQAQASGELDFEELCEGITSRSTCTETDVRAAISGILYEAKRALKTPCPTQLLHCSTRSANYPNHPAGLFFPLSTHADYGCPYYFSSQKDVGGHHEDS